MASCYRQRLWPILVFSALLPRSQWESPMRLTLSVFVWLFYPVDERLCNYACVFEVLGERNGLSKHTTLARSFCSLRGTHRHIHIHVHTQGADDSPLHSRRSFIFGESPLFSGSRLKCIRSPRSFCTVLSLITAVICVYKADSHRH